MFALADFIVEMLLSCGAFIGGKLICRFPKVFSALQTSFLLGLAAILVWCGYAVNTSNFESAKNASSFLYCASGLFVLFAIGVVLKWLVPVRKYKFISAVAMTISAAVYAGISIWCFVARKYTSGALIAAVVLVCGFFAAISFRDYQKAKYGK